MKESKTDMSLPMVHYAVSENLQSTQKEEFQETKM
jgi:hypothetical protein